MNNLCKVVTGHEESGFYFDKYWQWYRKHLEACAVALGSLVVLVIAGLRDDIDISCIEAKIKLYKVLVVVAQNLDRDEEASISTIIAELNTEKLFNEDNNNLAAQLVFQMIGWLSAIWDPLPDTSATTLRLKRVNTGRKRCRGFCRSDTALNITEVSHPRLHHVARRFGDILPTPQNTQAAYLPSSRDAEAALINNVYLSFDSLESLVSIKLVWTGCMNQHLQYDAQSKTLCVFKYPSICFLMCKEDGQTILSQMFESERRELVSTGSQAFCGHATFDAFALELLQSYRLIFGANAEARKRAAPYVDVLKSHSKNVETVDPLLELLCTANKDSIELKEFFSGLELELYDNRPPISEFPFFSGKLLRLQETSMLHTPSSMTRLWNDRRNPATWFALWAVLIIGVGTLILQFVQCLLQALVPGG